MPIHRTAVVDPKAEIDPSVDIGPYAIIEGPVCIAAGTKVYAHAYITGWTEIGRNCKIHPHTVVGGEPQDLAYEGTKTYCRIGDETVIREGATVHRGTDPGSATILGQRCFIMANAHVAHNCQLGDDVKLVNNVMLAGHVHVGNGAFFGGAAGIHQFVRIGELAMIRGWARITMDVPPFITAAHDSECVGVNVIGLRRAGFTPEQRDEIRQAYRILYRNGTTFTRAVETLAETVRTEPGKRLLEFVQSETKRGFARRPRRDTPEEE
jgi:UDP-N-acetylglucosamine acyltransferase